MKKIDPIQIQKFLGGVEYPADKESLIENARKKGADDNVLETLESLPDQEFETPADVSQAMTNELDNISETDEEEEDDEMEELDEGNEEDKDDSDTKK